MPFEPGMDDFLHSFAPVSLAHRLRLKPPATQLKRTREKVAAWYRTATALETRKPMQRSSPAASVTAGSDFPSPTVVVKRVNYANGNSYQGEWVNGKRHGKGQYLCTTRGYLYRGEWAHDTLHGQGSMFTRQPDRTWFLVYVGDYKRGLRDGWGTMRSQGDEYYEGYWKRGKREGWGRHFSDEGTIYEGQWHDDKRSGYGCTREATGNYHVGEYLEGRKHGAGKYNFIQTGKRLDGHWKNDIPVLGEISQLRHYKPSFPHQHPLPEQGVRDPRAILAAGLQDSCRKVPRSPPVDPTDSRVTGTKVTKVTKVTSVLRGEMDMRQLLVEVEPEVAAIRDPYVAAKTGDFLLATEYWWRSNADRSGPRPLRVQRLMAKNSQELLSLTG